MVLTKKQFNALSQAEKGKVVRKSRKRVNRAQQGQPRAAPARNGQGRRRGQRRQRGGKNGMGPNVRGMFGPQNVDRSSAFAGGPMVRNIKKMSAPEPFSGDELIATVLGSVAFTTTQFNINPANPTTFPWFNNIAKLYERYRFTDLEFYFQHDVSQFATQGTTGLILLSALYDAASAAPTSKTQIEATDPRVICMPNENSCLTLDNKGMHPVGEPKYCLPSGVPPGGTDIKTYNVGSLFVTTQGMQNASEIGELHVRYKGLLYDRILDASAASAPTNFTVTSFSNTAGTPLATAVPIQLPLAGASNNGLNIVNTAGSMVPSAGNYYVSWMVEFSSSGNSTEFHASIQKNAAVQPVATAIQEWAGPSGAYPTLGLSGSTFVTANGTDAFLLTVESTFSTGVSTVNGVCTWIAV